MTKEEVCQLFMAGIDCSQVVTGACAEKMGMTKEQARKMSACFGGGMMCGETCGAVTGALMVLGMVFGHSEENDGDQKGVMAGKVAEFKKRFLENILPICAVRSWDMIFQNREKWIRCWKKALCLISVRRLFWMCCLF